MDWFDPGLYACLVDDHRVGGDGTDVRFSDTWQLVINTGTTIVTFLMVFLLQRAQNKDSQAIHLKLNELVAATTGSSNRLIDAECLTEKEMELLKNHYKRLVELSQQEEDLTKSHSVEEAAERQSSKSRVAPAAAAQEISTEQERRSKSKRATKEMSADRPIGEWNPATLGPEAS